MSEFSAGFQADLLRLMRRRRDVRRFRTDPVDDAILRDCLTAFSLAPSVGLSEPWRVVRVRSRTPPAPRRGRISRPRTPARSTAMTAKRRAFTAT